MNNWNDCGCNKDYNKHDERDEMILKCECYKKKEDPCQKKSFKNQGCCNFNSNYNNYNY